MLLTLRPANDPRLRGWEHSILRITQPAVGFSTAFSAARKLQEHKNSTKVLSGTARCAIQNEVKIWLTDMVRCEIM